MFSLDFILGDAFTHMPYHSEAHRKGTGTYFAVFHNAIKN